jgi:DNA-binding NarL/FixJ family response regulator
MLSAFGEVNDVLPLLQAGATGYLVKEASLAEIAAAVRAVAQGKIPLSPTVAANMAVHQVRSVGESAQRPLTQREREVLGLVVAGKSNRQIAMILKISEKTVEKHLTEIFRELKVTTRGAAAVRAVRERLV